MRLSPNDVAEEIRRVERQNYNQFVKSIRIRSLRGIVGQEIEFKYPVTALIAPNGGGKSTILGATAMAYKETKPAKFFPKAFIGDESMADWSIEFNLVDKPTRAQGTVTRSARFAQSKWRRNDLISRNVVYIEIQRTVPAGELTAFRRFIGLSGKNSELKELSENTLTYAGAVLDKDISDYRKVHFEGEENINLLVRRSEEDGYSQFHFGAGEASIISTVERIETAPENSLILIEEVENGLHPVAVSLFVHYLQNVARRRRHQVVFTTHSQDAINALPSVAVWSILNRRVLNGPLSIESLRAVSGNVPDARVVFVEDEFVEKWTSNAIHRYGADFAGETKVFKAGGYPNVVKVAEYHNGNPSIVTPAVAIVDGDIFEEGDVDKLPGFAAFLGSDLPEKIVFDYIYKNRVDLVSLVRQRCLLSAFTDDDVVNALEGVRNSACGVHQVFSALSERLNFISSLHIRAGMIDIFNERNPDFLD